MNAYSVVEQFEARVAQHFNLAHGIAVDCCTSAIFLSLMYRKAESMTAWAAHLPAHTYISVPFAVMDAGITPRFTPEKWTTHYAIEPWAVMDAAKLWDGAATITPHFPPHFLWCVSFHIKKPVPIGRGGMILTSDDDATAWLRKARYDGRTPGVPLAQDVITTRGWHRYMTPEQAARGLALLDVYPGGFTIEPEDYPDLSHMPVFAGV